VVVFGNNTASDISKLLSKNITGRKAASGILKYYKATFWSITWQSCYTNITRQPCYTWPSILAVIPLLHGNSDYLNQSNLQNFSAYNYYNQGYCCRLGSGLLFWSPVLYQEDTLWPLRACISTLSNDEVNQKGEGTLHDAYLKPTWIKLEAFLDNFILLIPRFDSCHILNSGIMLTAVVAGIQWNITSALLRSQTVVLATVHSIVNIISSSEPNSYKIVELL